MGFAADRPERADEPLPYHASPPISPQGVGARAARMVEHILHAGSHSTGDALRELRAAFPDSPLTVRVAALQLIMRQRGRASS